MRFREAVRLARRNGACREAIEELRKMRDWEEFLEHPRSGEWRAWWIRNGLPNPGQPGVWEMTGHVPIAEEETDRLPKRFPTLDKEPHWVVRWWIAKRIPVDMIDLWNLQPRWLKRLRLFLGIVWRMHEGSRMTVCLSWDVALCMYPYRRRRKK